MAIGFLFSPAGQGPGELQCFRPGACRCGGGLCWTSNVCSHGEDMGVRVPWKWDFFIVGIVEHVVMVDTCDNSTVEMCTILRTSRRGHN